MAMRYIIVFVRMALSCSLSLVGLNISCDTFAHSPPIYVLCTKTESVGVRVRESRQTDVRYSCRCEPIGNQTNSVQLIA